MLSRQPAARTPRQNLIRDRDGAGAGALARGGAEVEAVEVDTRLDECAVAVAAVPVLTAVERPGGDLVVGGLREEDTKSKASRCVPGMAWILAVGGGRRRSWLITKRHTNVTITIAKTRMDGLELSQCGFCTRRESQAWCSSVPSPVAPPTEVNPAVAKARSRSAAVQ